MIPIWLNMAIVKTLLASCFDQGTHGSGQLADLLQCATIGGVEGAGCTEIQSLFIVGAEAVVW